MSPLYLSLFWGFCWETKETSTENQQILPERGLFARIENARKAAWGVH